MDFFNHYASLEALRGKIASRSYTPAKFTNVLRKHFNNPDIIFRTVRCADLKDNEIVVSGYYDPFDDEENVPHIGINIFYSPSQKEVTVTNINWEDIRFQLAEIICHEMIHRRQYRARDYDSPLVDHSLTKAQEYLGNPDEIEAYGFSIAASRSVGNKAGREILASYIELFGCNHYVVIKLLQYVRKYFSTLRGNENGDY